MDRAFSRASQLRLAESQAWLRLLQVQRDYFFFIKRSQIDRKDFFLAPNGAWNPREELEATLKGLLQDSTAEDPNQLVACKYPARSRFLQRELRLADFGYQSPSCPNFGRFQNQVQATGVSVVFSSYHLKSAASMFGHTFLRLHRKRDAAGGDLELLDFGINFAATIPDGTNKLWFSLGGLAGAFPGEYSAVPFYFKVREYVDFEVRDLWSYELDFNQDQVDHLVAYLWEMGSAHFNYYFFTENCSYHILSALEAARPDLNLKKQLPFWTIPTDTLKAIDNSPGLVRSVSFRPSQRRVFLQRYHGLSATERGVLLKWVRTKNWNDLQSLPKESQRKVLDAAVDHFNAVHAQALAKKEAQLVEERMALLVARARLGGMSPEISLQVPKQEDPRSGHGSTRMGLHGSLVENAWRGELEWRFAFHDLLDPTNGYPSLSEIRFVDTRVSWTGRGSPRLEKAELLGIKSFVPVDSVSWPLSFDFSAGLDRNSHERFCADCLRAQVSFHGGFSFAVLPRLHAGALLGGDVERRLNSSTKKEWAMAVSPKAVLHWRPAPSTGLLLSASQRFYLRERPSPMLQLGVRQGLSQSSAVDVESIWEGRAVSWRAGLYLYF